MKSVFFYTIFLYFRIIHANYRCNEMAHQLIDIPHDSSYEIQDCKFVKLHYEDHRARQLKILIESDNEIIESLDLHETDGLLADFSTPIYQSRVYAIERDGNRSKVDDYRIDTLSLADYAPGLGYFTMYHDRKKSASIIYTFNGILDISVDGNIGDYILRRTIVSFEGYYEWIYVKVGLKVPVDTEEIYEDPDDFLAESYNLDAFHLEKVQIKFLVLLDLQPSYNKPPKELIKKVLMYYNYIDMMYGNFSSPGIRITIDGIHVPESTHPNPYLGYTNPNATALSMSSIDSVEEFTKKEKNFLNLTSHTVVVVMTQRNVYSNTEKNVPLSLRTATVNYHKACSNYDKPSIFISNNLDFQAGHSNFLSQFYSIFTKNNFRYHLNDSCTKYMDNYRLRNFRFPRPWPWCIVHKYSYFFRTYDCSHIKTT